MRSWGKKSQKVYDELDECLQRVVTRVRDEIGDISLIDGYRGEIKQNEYYVTGVSTILWPHGKHNKKPSLAVDFRPFPMPTRKDKLWASLAYLASAAILIGKEEGVHIRWGGDWNENGNLSDQTFDDLFHIEKV